MTYTIGYMLLMLGIGIAIGAAIAISACASMIETYEKKSRPRLAPTKRKGKLYIHSIADDR